MLRTLSAFTTATCLLVGNAWSVDAAPAVKSSPSSSAAAPGVQLGTPTSTSTSTCSDGGRVRMQVSPSSEAGHVRVVVTVSGMQTDGARWEGGMHASSGDGFGDSVDFVRRAREGGWRAVATLEGSPSDHIGTVWFRRGRHVCVLSANGRGPLFAFSFCNGNDFGLNLTARRTDVPGRYRVQLDGGTDRGAGTGWRLRLGMRRDGVHRLGERTVVANDRGIFKMARELRLTGDTLLYVSARGPDGNFCRLASRRTW